MISYSGESGSLIVANILRGFDSLARTRKYALFSMACANTLNDTNPLSAINKGFRVGLVAV